MHTQKFAAGMCARTHTNQQAKAFQGRYGQEGKGLGNFRKRRKIKETFLFIKPSFLKVKKKNNNKTKLGK